MSSDRPSTVGSLDLVIASDAPDRDVRARLAGRIERELVPRVLEAATREVRARRGDDAILCVKELSVEWTLDSEAVDEAATADALGRELAGAILAGAVEPSLDGDFREPWVVFAGRAHMLAAWIVSESRRDTGASHPWPFSPLTVDAVDPRAAIATATAVEVAEILARIEPAADVGDLIETLGAPVLAALFDVVPVDRWPRRCRASALRVLGGDRESREAREPRHAGDSTSAGAPASPDTPNAPTEEDALESTPDRSGDIAANRARGLEAPSPTESIGDEPVEPVRAVQTAVEAELAIADEAPRAISPELGQPTELAGLFFLALPVLELGIAESLWCGGADERAALFGVAAVLAGPHSDDPAIAAFSGVDSSATRSLPAWATDEIVAKSKVELASALARRLDWHLEPEELEQFLAGAAGTLAGGGPDLCRELAAVLTVFFNSRRGAPTDAPLSDALVASGRLVATGETLEVIIDGAVDIDLRRAGLDFNPGYIPWLEKSVAITYAGLDEL